MFGIVSEETKRYTYMWEVFNQIMRFLCQDKRSKEDRPEVHITFNSLKTLNKYYKNTTVYKSLNALSMISFSQLGITDLTGLLSLKDIGIRTHMNYNYLIPGNITSFNIDKYVNHLIQAAEVVDSIYLVIFKRPVGGHRDKMTTIGDVSRMTNDILFINTLMERIPANVRRKFQVDGCLQDTRESQRTGFGCSSNVSRMQVWPNGSVSGCPYAFDTNGKAGAKSAQDIVANIKEERKRYDFKEKCHLPEVLNIIE
jgi:hypothetical protein